MFQMDVDTIANEVVYLASMKANNSTYYLTDINVHDTAVWSKVARNGIIFSSYDEISQFLKDENLHPTVTVDCVSVERWLLDEDAHW